MVERNAHSPAFHLIDLNKSTYMVVGGDGKKTERNRQLSNRERETREGRLVGEKVLGENIRERGRGRKLNDRDASGGGVRGSTAAQGRRSAASVVEKEGGGWDLMNEKEGGGIESTQRRRDMMDGDTDGVVHYDMQIITRSEIERLKTENCLFVYPSMLAL